MVARNLTVVELLPENERENAPNKLLFQTLSPTLQGCYLQFDQTNLNVASVIAQ